jgi:branched-chain amino acid transport system permease protein
MQPPGSPRSPPPEGAPDDGPGSARRLWPWLALAAGAALPTLAAAFGLEFYVSLASRILILAMLATSLNLLVGLGGMVSLGHAAFYGTGAYTVAIAAFECSGQGPWASALVAWPVAMGAGALLALVVGAVSMRTRGPYFIMITLAFAQAVYYVAVSLKRYGGDDGLSLPARSRLPGLDLAGDAAFYYVVLALLALSIVVFARVADSRFGTVLRAIKDNEVRAESLGYPCVRVKRVAFVIAGAWAALAGALMANHGSFVSPNLMHWEQSGTALVIVILGGIGHPWGGLAGAAVYLLIEEAFSAFTQRWAIGLGMVLLAVVFHAPHGVAGALRRRR